MWEVPYATSVGKHVGEVLVDATIGGVQGKRRSHVGI
jgi:hypothetical protein